MVIHFFCWLLTTSLAFSATEEIDLGTSADAISKSWNIFVGGSLAKEVRTRERFGSSTTDGVSDGSHEFGPAINLGFRYAKIPGEGLGYTGGYSYDTQREYTATSVSGFRDSGPRLKISAHILEANLALGLEPFYGLVGPNFAYPILHGANGTIKGSLGLQAGGGIKLFKDFSVEILYRYLNFVDTGADFIKMNGIVFHGVYIFR